MCCVWFVVGVVVVVDDAGQLWPHSTPVPTSWYSPTVSAIVEVSVSQATYFDIPQIGVKTDFFFNLYR